MSALAHAGAASNTAPVYYEVSPHWSTACQAYEQC